MGEWAIGDGLENVIGLLAPGDEAVSGTRAIGSACPAMLLGTFCTSGLAVDGLVGTIFAETQLFAALPACGHVLYAPTS